MQNHNSSGGKSGKKKGLCFLDQMRQANSIIGWCSSIQTQIQMQIQFQIQIQIPIPDQSDPHLEPCLCTSLIFISLNLVCCSSASVEKGARMLVSVSTAFKFLLLKFMSAKVIFHIVFPAAQCHPSVFFCRVFRFLIVSFSVFPLFRVLFVDAGGHGYRGGFFGFGFLVGLVLGLGFWVLIRQTRKPGNRSPVIGNCFSIFVCATFRGDSCRQKFLQHVRRVTNQMQIYFAVHLNGGG